MKTIEALPENDRNLVVIAAAKTLAVRDYREGMTSAEWEAYVRKECHSFVPNKSSVKGWAADLLYNLSEKRLIATPEVIPYLVEGLKHPAQQLVVSGCWQALGSLTRHRTGWKVFSDYQERNNAEMRQRCIAWWEDWWTANKNNQPIFAPAIEERTRNAFCGVAKEMEKLKARFPEMAFYQSPGQETETNRLRLIYDYLDPIYSFSYFPAADARWSPGRGPGMFIDHTQTVHELYINIHAGFQSKDIDSDIRETGFDHVRTPPPELVFSQTLKGTDIAIRIQAGTENKAFLHSVRELFQGYALE